MTNAIYTYLYFVMFIKSTILITSEYTLTGPTSATEGSTVTFTCTTSPVQIGVSWSEKSGSNTESYVYFYNSGRCLRSTGAPPSDYTFDCNSTGVFSLSFPADYSRHHGSMFKCSNPAGPGENNIITLSVTVPVSSVTLTNITSNNQQVPVNQDSSLVLTCQTSPAYPAPTVKWYVNSSMTSSGVDNKTETQTSGQIVTVSTITRTMRKNNDQETFYCLAENINGVAGTQSKTARANVFYGPDDNMVNVTKPAVIVERNDVTLTCSTLTPVNPEVNFTWSWGDNTAITEGFGNKQGVARGLWSQTMTVRAVRDSNRQKIRCDVINTQTSRSEHLVVDLNVSYGPDANQVNLTKPAVIAERNNVTLTCSTVTPVNPEVDFTWTLGDNTTITAGLGNKQGVARGLWSQTLTVRAVRDSNRQEIRCDVINTQTSRSERVVVDLDVSYGPDSGDVQVSKSSTAVELEPLSLTCSTTNNVKPGVIFNWTIDGSEVSSGTGIIQGSSGGKWSQTLTLTPKRNQNSVGCTVINTAIARQESSSVDLDVNYPPDISLSPVEGPQNTDLTLTCTATGNPSNFSFEDFRQYWGDQLIQRRGGTQTGDRYSLDLHQVSYQDSGVYVCTVGNNVKQPTHKNATVTVQASPVYTQDVDTTEPVGAEVGQSARLVQYVYCNPNFTLVSWHFNTTNTTNSRLSTNSSNVSSSPVHLDVYGTQVEVAGFKLVYTVTNFQQKHVGLYIVRVCNSVGCAESSRKLIGSGPPETPLLFRALNSTTDSVTLAWTPQYAGGDYTQEFHVQFRVQNTSGDWSSRVFPLSQDNSGAGVVDGLDSNTGYVFRIKSVTDRKTGNNTSPVSGEIYVSTKKVPKVPSPLPLGAIAGGIVGGVAFFILVAVLLVFLRRRKQSKGGDRERLRSGGQNGDIVMEPNVLYETSGNVSREQPVMQKNDIYESADAVGGAEAKAPGKASVIHSEVKKKKPEESVNDVYAEVKKTDKKQQKKKDAGKKDKGKMKDTTPAAKAKRDRGDVYENAMPGRYGDDANTYANAGFEGDEPEAKNENPQPPTGRDADGCLYVGIDFGNQKPGKVIIGDDKNPYADIAFGKVGHPPAPDEEKKKKTDTASK